MGISLRTGMLMPVGQILDTLALFNADHRKEEPDGGQDDFDED